MSMSPTQQEIMESLKENNKILENWNELYKEELKKLHLENKKLENIIKECFFINSKGDLCHKYLIPCSKVYREYKQEITEIVNS